MHLYSRKKNKNKLLFFNLWTRLQINNQKKKSIENYVLFIITTIY